MKKITVTILISADDERPFGPCCMDSMTTDDFEKTTLGCHCPYRNGVNMYGKQRLRESALVTESKSESCTR